ncbi:MAG: hypothetical protein LAT63_13320 [Marinobacter sp.]|nr:hypothetical protein [Marinobacter sp.]
MHASVYHLPQPWRMEAVLEGRDESFNDERLMHRFSYRHSQPEPAITDNGIRGTGGSVSSKRLYHDFRFRQDFGFNDDRQAFLLDIQRSEDLDGYYERQLVGFRYNLNDRRSLWLQGDVFGDKARSDVYFSARQAVGSDGWLHGSWILSDAYFNDKTLTEDRLTTLPYSFYLQWHRPGTTVSATYAAPARLDSDSQRLTVRNEHLKGAVTQHWQHQQWHYTVNLEGEHSERSYRLDEAPTTAQDFRREYYQLTLEAQWQAHPRQPRLGASYLTLRERGYFGRALDSTGTVKRSEPLVFGSLAFPVNERQTLRPALYGSFPRVDQQFASEDINDRDSERFVGKLMLPWEILLSPRDNAVLTLAASFRLHRAAFGGGNLQLHWPL